LENQRIKIIIEKAIISLQIITKMEIFLENNLIHNSRTKSLKATPAGMHGSRMQQKLI